MRSFNFEVTDNTIHILEYPNADMVLELPKDRNVIRLMDMSLHWMDLVDAKNSLEAITTDTPNVVRTALAQNAIVLFFKCFGQNKFRNNPLKRDKILANFPSEAKAVFDYYKNLRNKFIVHDESRYAQVQIGLILESSKDYPFVDIVNGIFTTDKFQGDGAVEGLQSFYRLVLAAITWTEKTIDELSDLIKSEYKDKPLSEFRDFLPLQLQIPTNDELFQRRY